MVKIYSISDMSLLAAGRVHSKGVNDLKWSPDEKQLVSGSHDCGIAVWNFFSLE